MARPERADFTRREWSWIQQAPEPMAVQRLFNRLPYNAEPDGPTLRSFRGVVRARTAHCLEAALGAAVILEQHGWSVLLLDLQSQDKLDHVLFLFRHRGRWGTVGRSRDPGLHGRRPVFDSIPALVDSYFDPFVDASGRIVGYAVDDLSALGGYDWRLSGRNVWKVERHLIDRRHKRFHGADARYRRWLARYREFKARHPDRKPLYYPGRRTWMPIP